MNNNINTANALVSKNQFAAGYNNLPAIKQNEVRERLMNECGWNSLVTFYNKRRGSVEIRYSEILIIEKIFWEYGINPWTGLMIANY